jgi:hypothetical protein
MENNVHMSTSNFVTVIGKCMYDPNVELIMVLVVVLITKKMLKCAVSH